jgi:hypothetical protein
MRKEMKHESIYHLLSDLDQIFSCYQSHQVAHLSVHILHHSQKEKALYENLVKHLQNLQLLKSLENDRKCSANRSLCLKFKTIY